MRVAMPVECAHRDDRRGRLDTSEPTHRRRVPAAVVADVEQAGSQRVAQSRRQCCLGSLAYVPSQKHTAPGVAHQKHDRCVVSGRRRPIWAAWHPIALGMKYIDFDRSLLQVFGGSELDCRRRRVTPDRGKQTYIRWIIADGCRASPSIDPNAIDDTRGAAHVVEIRVGRDQPLQTIDPSSPEVHLESGSR